jgi:hypothetical protein
MTIVTVSAAAAVASRKIGTAATAVAAPVMVATMAMK